jgi:hypothetical protein
MLGAAGVLVPELLTKAGVADLPTWAEAGKAEYFTDPVTLFLIQGILFNWVEVLRWKDMRNPGSVHEVRRRRSRLARSGVPGADASLARQDPIFKGNKVTGTEVGYPGGRWFDPLNFAAEPKVRARGRVRLALVPPAHAPAPAGLRGEQAEGDQERPPRDGGHGWLLRAGVRDRQGPRGQPVVRFPVFVAPCLRILTRYPLRSTHIAAPGSNTFFSH